MIRVRSEEK